ncbi:MAG: DNA gyrase inhibitor YacG [Deltaproteobacteria bacterium CG07_land_8_20_14_0_80_38_7]|nr:MAG: DNA gyrase inhibitor YacG [Deltaproteobacteria bacterium CG07_land_8_20_14_0_80_38_7]
MDKNKIILCPQCKKPVTWKDNPYRPFCSERCKIIDLGDWAAERYRIPDKEIGSEEDFNENEKDILE